MSETLILGGGVTGQALARFFKKRDEPFILYDDNTNPSRTLSEIWSAIGCPQIWGKSELVNFKELKQIIYSPGIATKSLLLKEAANNAIPIYGELEFSYQCIKKKDPHSQIIGITGTNGKSTTTHLTATMLLEAGVDSAPCGNLGIPMIEAVEQYRPGQILVVEASSYQLESCQNFRPQAGAFLNLTSDHLARHGTLDNYRNSKLQLFSQQTENDIAVFPRIPSNFAEGALGLAAKWYFGLHPHDSPLGAYLDAKGNLSLSFDSGPCRPFARLDDLCIPGNHNVLNVLASSILAHKFGASADSLKKTLKHYKGLPHRLFICAHHDGVTFINDSKSTNIDSTLVAIEAIKGPMILILGGVHKGASYKPLLENLQQRSVKLIFIGEAIPQLEEDLSSIPHESVKRFDDGVRRAFDLAPPNSTVLLSPACSSFDQFENFEQRGIAFEHFVNEWISSKN